MEATARPGPSYDTQRNFFESRMELIVVAFKIREAAEEIAGNTRSGAQ